MTPEERETLERPAAEFVYDIDAEGGRITVDALYWNLLMKMRGEWRALGE